MSGDPRPAYLELRELSKHFGGVRALDGVSLSVPKGSVHALVGENGAGKSTLGRIVAGALAPDSGAIRLDGRDVSFRSPREALDHRVAAIAQEPSIVPHLVSVETASFPSGHSMQSTIVYATLGALLARFAKRRATQVLPIAAAVAIAFLVGVSRLVLGVHYPSDVLAGWAAGAAWAAASWIVVDSLAREGAVEGRTTPPA